MEVFVFLCRVFVETTGKLLYLELRYLEYHASLEVR